MEGLLEFITIIFGVLSIILFFKIWRMCNHVKQIKNQLTQIDDDIESKFNFLMSIGEKDKAKEILISYILSDESIFYEHSHVSDDYKLNKIKENYGDALKSLGILLPDKLEPQD